MNWKKYLPAVIIGLVVLYLVKKLSGSGGGSGGVYNALVPQSTTSPVNRDNARVAGYNTLASVGLGQLKLAEQGSELTQQVALARDRFAAQLQGLNITQQGAFQRLQAELADRQYDREIQLAAINQTAALAQSGQIGNQAGQALQALLNAIAKGRQAASGGSGSGSAGQPQQQRRTVPQMSQAAYNRLRQSALLQSIFGSGDPTANYQNPQFGGGFFDVTDWGSGPTGSSYEPVGSVSSSFDYIDPWYAPAFDYSLPVGSQSFEDWYNDYGWQYDY